MQLRTELPDEYLRARGVSIRWGVETSPDERGTRPVRLAVVDSVEQYRLLASEYPAWQAARDAARPAEEAAAEEAARRAVAQERAREILRQFARAPELPTGQIVGTVWTGEDDRAARTILRDLTAGELRRALQCTERAWHALRRRSDGRWIPVVWRDLIWQYDDGAFELS